LGFLLRRTLGQYHAKICYLSRVKFKILPMSLQPNDDDRWPTDGFYVEYAPYDTEHVEYRLRQLVLGPNARHAIISRLVASTSYSIRMQSYGGSGSGQARVRSAYSNVVVHDTLGMS